MLLAFAGGSAGVALGYGFLRVLSSLSVRASIPLELRCRLDPQALGWTLAITLVLGVGFGLAPAVATACTRHRPSPKRRRADAIARLRPIRVAQLVHRFSNGGIADACLVTGLVTTAFLLAIRINPGFEVANLSLISLDPMRDGYSAAEATTLLESVPAELSRVRGIRAVSLSDAPPLAWFAAAPPTIRLSASRGEARKEAIIQTVSTAHIGANYFATLGEPLASGREFERRELGDMAENGETVPAILNQTATRLLFGPENPVGRRIRQGETSYTVVGVARDSQPQFLRSKPEAIVFLPFTAAVLRENPAQVTTVLLRGRPGDVLGAVRGQLASLHPGLTVFNARTMEQDLNNWSSFFDWQSSIFVILGIFALLLASIGLGEVTAYAVARRRKEIAIRMALGARGSQVQRLVLREAAALAAVGSIFGFGGAFLLSRLLTAYSDMLARTFDRPVSGPLLMIVAPLVLVSLTLVACYLPAHRATRIEPIAALRQE